MLSFTVLVTGHTLTRRAL